MTGWDIPPFKPIKLDGVPVPADVAFGAVKAGRAVNVAGKIILLKPGDIADMARAHGDALQMLEPDIRDDPAGASPI